MKDMSKPDNEIEVEKLLNKMDNYRQTVGAIVALSHTLIRYYAADVRVGHPLKPSSQNRIQNKDYVTPDIVSQGNDLNLIGEVKKSFPSDKTRWLQNIKQVEKYDDEFTNWINRDVKTHDVMLLTHYSPSAVRRISGSHGLRVFRPSMGRRLASALPAWTRMNIPRRGVVSDGMVWNGWGSRSVVRFFA